ncbi:hypothetical protein RCH09_000465 [Actimicrobium sp. GrIS 1.19]|uniref:hypothetical protein n=1 Tax=Actimicrobium sp. GrIS 1.19 TaxID=3071708 RepID=UPI002E0592FB|nr:hypothetical protein [Actimicrobium sp. GrIS 1.19]
MTTTTLGYEFEFPVDGIKIGCFVSPVCADDGHVNRVVITRESPDGLVIADIGISPQIFKQFAMPNIETMCRIAIAQAASEQALSGGAALVEVMLDFAIEPWEGALAPT